jgi:hypothetical protein
MTFSFYQNLYLLKITYIHKIYDYLQNLERYLDKTFKDQRFLPMNKTVRLTGNKIELEIPSEVTQGYKVATYMGCQVSCYFSLL